MSTFRVATYNIRHAKGVDGSVSLDRVAQTLSCINADIIALQEVDKHMPRSFFRNQAKILACHTGTYYSFAPNIRFLFFSSFGNALLSRYPIVDAENLRLPGKKEHRGLQQCTVLLPGKQKIYFFNTHLGLSAKERAVQVRSVVKTIAMIPCPVVLAGDFNCTPDEGELKLIFAHLQYAHPHPIGTYPSTHPLRALDHIYVSHHWTAVDMFTYPSQASDHLPLVCNLKLNV